MSADLTRWQIGATLAVLVLTVVTTLSGIFRPTHYVDPPGLVRNYVIQDVTVLLVGVPVLAAGLRYAMRGSLRGRLVWLGSLAYMSYIWCNVGLQVRFNAFFLVYVALFGLSLFTFVSGLQTTDPRGVKQALDGRISRPTYSGFLVVIATGLATLWLSEILPASLSGAPPLIVVETGQQALVSHFIDLSVVVPALVISAVWLWRGRAWGYVLAGVSLVLGATLAVTISATTVAIATGETITLSPVAALFTAVPIAVAAVLAVTYLAAMEDQSSSRTAESAQ